MIMLFGGGGGGRGEVKMGLFVHEFQHGFDDLGLDLMDEGERFAVREKENAERSPKKNKPRAGKTRRR